MFQCLPLLEGRVHISERTFLLSGWVAKRNTGFLRVDDCPFLSNECE